MEFIIYIYICKYNTYKLIYYEKIRKSITIQSRGI